MQTNALLESYANQDMRQLSWRLTGAFDKAFDDNITFFTIGTSAVGGTDFLPGTNEIVQEWDKYRYTDYSDRVIRIDWKREVDPVSSIVSATADLVLNNFDDLFSSGDYVKPSRPIKLFAGFEGENVPVFVGVTAGRPNPDERSKTVVYHCQDFLSVILKRNMDTIAGLQNVMSDEAISEVLEQAGLSPTQYDLDPGFNQIPFFYADKGITARTILEKIMVAEQGRLEMDEQGVIRFYNRQNVSNERVWNFNAYENIIDSDKPFVDDIINHVAIKATLRSVQANQLIYQTNTAREIPAGGTLEVWADFNDPVTGVDAPVYIDSATTSSFKVNTQPDGSGSADSSSVTLTSDDVFSKSYKMVFANSSGSDLYITEIILYGTPAKTVSVAYIDEQDDVSIEQFEEQNIEINSDFFASESEAQSKAIVLLEDYSSDIPAVNLDIKGSPQLQLNDLVYIDLFGRTGEYRITRIDCELSKTYFKQRLRVKSFDRRTYFSIEGSQIGGTDELAP